MYLTENIIHVANEINWHAKQYGKKNVKTAKSIYLSPGIVTLLIFLKSKSFFGLLVLMGIIDTPNILKHWFTDSLYDTLTFQKLSHVIDFIYFRNLYTSITKETPAMMPMMGKEAVVTKFTFLLI